MEINKEDCSKCRIYKDCPIVRLVEDKEGD